jgi:DNA (cytosine-5)-methyltransferase 1
LNAFDNTGDSRATVLVFAPGPMVRFGGNIWEGIVPTLRAESHRGDAEPHILIIDGTRVDDVRVYEGPVQTLKERMGTGGNNVPIIAFDGYNQSVTEDIYRALRIGIDSGDCIAIPIHDQATRFNGRRGDKQDGKGNGLGIGHDGDPMLTLTQGDRHAVAETTLGETMQVRRLTPVECERLMGWPDNHTLPRSDGKQNPDTTRYKMCGNGVASPVAQWIGQHLMAIMNDQ